MLKQMWKFLFETKALTPNVVAARDKVVAIPTTSKNPVLYCCQHCGAGVSAQSLIWGGIIGRRGQVKANIRCNDCGKHTAFSGSSPFHRGVIVILMKQPRRRPGERARVWRNGNVA